MIKRYYYYFYDPYGKEKAVFKDECLSRPHKQPIRTSWFGNPPPIYMDDGYYNVELRDSKNKLIWIKRMWEQSWITVDNRGQLIAGSFDQFLWELQS